MFRKFTDNILIVSIAFVSLTNLTQAQTPAWIQLFPTDSTSVTARNSHTAIYDTANNRMTIFGGYSDITAAVVFNDVWVLNYADGLEGTPVWTQLSPTGVPPSPRYSPTAVYDTTNNRMTIFGGNNGPDLNDVWVLSNANGLDSTSPAWIQLSPNPDPTQTTNGYGGLPPVRTYHTAVYDATNNRMTIFGGSDNANNVPTYATHYNDVWVLSYANGLGGTSAWTQLSPTPDPTQTTNGYGGFPPIRGSHTVVYDPTNNTMTIFGGTNSPYLYDDYNFNDVWMLSNANGLDTTTPTWKQLFPIGSSPTTRYGHTAVYDNTNNRMTIFGGYDGDYQDGDYLSDVWVLSNANGLDSTTSAWTQLSPTGSTPTTRAYHSVVYDATNNRMTIFGGFNGTQYNDVWVLNMANGLPVELSSFEAIKE
jgi:hypothetical protein